MDKWMDNCLMTIDWWQQARGVYVGVIFLYADKCSSRRQVLVYRQPTITAADKHDGLALF